MLLLRSIALSLCLLLVAETAHATPSPFTGLVITRIVLKDDSGNPWTRADQIEELISIKPGDPFTGSAIRQGISLLYLKGVFRDIIVEAFPEQGGVRLEYTFVPVTVVEKVEIRGNHALSKAPIRDVLAGAEGKILRLDRLAGFRTEILALYQAAGYYNTEVTFRIEIGPAPNAEALQAVADTGETAPRITINDKLKPHRAVLWADINEGAPTIIREIVFAGNTVIKFRKLQAAIQSRVGSPLNRDQLLDADKEAILKKYIDAGYPEAKVGPVDVSFSDHGASVRIVVSEGPLVTTRFTGNKALSSKKLRQSLLVWSEHDVSDAVVDSSSDRIKALYREQGYADVAVEAKKTETPGVIVLDFAVTEGPRVKVKHIELRGNAAFTTKEIKEGMALKESGWSWALSWGFVPVYWYWPSYYREDLLSTDIDNLQDRYVQAGYQSAVIKKKVSRSMDGREANVLIEIAEGARTMTGSVSFEGNTVFSTGELQKMAALKPGEPFSERLMDEARFRIQSAYENKGYLYTRVETERTTGDDTVNVRYRISEGRLVHIGRIILRGNERTKDYVILRQILVKPGDPYDYGAILESQQQIYHLGYFRLAKFEPAFPGDRDYTEDMLLTMEERPAGAVEVGFGYGDLDRLRGFVELSHRNLFGTAKYSSVRYEQSDILKRGIFNFQEPWFMNRRLDAKFSLVWSDSKLLNSQTRELYYKTRKTSAAFGIEKAYEKLKPSLTYQFENVVNYDVLAAAQVTPEDSGRVLVSSLSPALIWDGRDDVFNPHRGALYGVVLKEALRELFSQADFSKLTVQAQWYLPIDNTVVAFSSRAGMAWPFRGTLAVPLHERFYVGGNTTVRGYTQDSIGPSAADPSGTLIPQGGASMAVFNIELRLNPGEGLGLVLFSDAGNAWSSQEINLKDLRESYGAGIRYGTPIGPIRIDYGQKIRRLPGESVGELHFNIGNTF